MIAGLSAQLRAAIASDSRDLARPALAVAALAYPSLEAEPSLRMLDRLGAAAAARMAASVPDPLNTPAGVDPTTFAHASAISSLLFTEEGFTGNDADYDDPRNSCLNAVLDRRTGMPLTLSIVFLEVARRACLRADGVNFPGHFLVVCPSVSARYPHALLIDPHHGGTVLTESMCRDLLDDTTDDDDAWDPALLRPASTRQILTRLLLNLKRAYVRLHSFPQAREISALLLEIDPTATTELRDHGLLSYQLRDYAGALRDLQRFLVGTARLTTDEDDRDDQARIWEHVKTLQRRLAGLN